MMNALKIHVFTAGTGSAQTRPFNDALIDLKASKVIGKNEIIYCSSHTHTHIYKRYNRKKVCVWGEIGRAHV
jgi:hypothetical protein